MLKSVVTITVQRDVAGTLHVFAGRHGLDDLQLADALAAVREAMPRLARQLDHSFPVPPPECLTPSPPIAWTLA